MPLQPSLRLAERRAEFLHKPPEPNRMVHLLHVRKLMKNEIVHHGRRNEQQAPVETQCAATRTTAPATLLIAHDDVLESKPERSVELLNTLRNNPSSCISEPCGEGSVDMIGIHGGSPNQKLIADHLDNGAFLLDAKHSECGFFPQHAERAAIGKRRFGCASFKAGSTVERTEHPRAPLSQEGLEVERVEAPTMRHDEYQSAARVKAQRQAARATAEMHRILDRPTADLNGSRRIHKHWL